MCGIIGYTGSSHALPLLIKGLKALEYRGYDSAGVAVASKSGNIETVKAVGRISALEEKLRGLEIDGNSGIGHTRWATHGGATLNNCHPHSSFGGKFTIVHNGIIENCDQLRSLCKKRKITLKSETDSELIAHLLEWEYSGDALAAIRRVLGELSGSYALCILCKDYPETLFAAAKRSPLLIGTTNEGVFVASDGTAMSGSLNSLIALTDGQYAIVTKSSGTVYSDGEQITPMVLNFRYTERECELCGFPHYMLKEMYEQPEAIARTLAVNYAESELTLKCQPLLLIGCGSSYNAAITALPMLTSAVNNRVTVTLASEYICSERISGSEELVILLSQSGETADTVAAAELAMERGHKTLAITNVPHSTLSRICDDSFITKAGPEIAVATTKGFTSQIAALVALAASQSEELRKHIDGIAFAAEHALGLQMEDWVDIFTHAPCVFFLGRQADYGIALEGALKFKEITYIPAFGIAAGELKHGSISLITEEVPVVVICTDELNISKTLLSIASVRARGGKVIAVTPFIDVANAANHSIILPKAHRHLAPIAAVIPLQKLTYTVADMLSRDIDKPRNLAKSVTVE